MRKYELTPCFTSRCFFCYNVSNCQKDLLTTMLKKTDFIGGSDELDDIEIAESYIPSVSSSNCTHSCEA